MLEFVIYMLFLIPLILGFAEILHKIKVYIMYGKDDIKKEVRFNLGGKNSVLKLSRIVSEYNWYGRNSADKIIISFCGNDEDSDECRKIAESNGFEFVNIRKYNF